MTTNKWLIYKRPGFKITKGLPDLYYIIDNQELVSDISSTKARNLLTQDLRNIKVLVSLKEILEQPVLDYIIKNNLHENYKEYYKN